MGTAGYMKDREVSIGCLPDAGLNTLDIPLWSSGYNGHFK